MTTPLPQTSAKIYQFPVRFRRNAGDHGVEAKPAVARDAPGAPGAPPMVYGSGWYHDAAIQDAQRTGKR